MWFFRVIELAPGVWACCHGILTFDTHPEMAQAVEHVRTLAAEKQPSALFVHRLDGTVRSLDAV